MTRYSPFDEEQIFFGEQFHQLEFVYGNLFVARMSSHALPFENFRWVRRSTDRARVATAIVLTVCTTTYTAKTVAFYNALKTFALRSTRYRYVLAFGKYVRYRDSLAQFLPDREVAELFYFSLWRSRSVLEVLLQRLCRIFGFFLAKTELQRIVAVCLFCFYLRYDAGPCLYDRARYVMTVGQINAGHADFASD